MKRHGGMEAWGHGNPEDVFTPCKGDPLFRQIRDKISPENWIAELMTVTLEGSPPLRFAAWWPVMKMLLAG